MAQQLEIHAGSLERELSTLRANLEQLAARWEALADGGQIFFQRECGDKVRRVLAGESPPELGQDWPIPPKQSP